MTASSSASEVVVNNQHRDNRGDEAAMRAMVNALSARLVGARFTIIHQFSDPDSEVQLKSPVEYISLKLPLLEAARLGLFAILTWARVPAMWILGGRGREIVDRYLSANLVISAPGGPYFGDIYADHEIVHWFFVWLGHLLGRPLFLYAPSVGPFGNRWLNSLRRLGFDWFDGVALRDSVSAGYLRQLKGEAFEFEVTADSALQESVEPPTHRQHQDFSLVVAVRDPGRDSRDEHDAGVVAAIDMVCRKYESSVTFLPQLHGPRHRDRRYLEGLASRVEGAKSVTVESDGTMDSDDHRRTVAQADLVIAGRYHPAVFSVAAGTPVIVIPYEHKSWGVARAAGIERWCIDYDRVSPDAIKQLVDEILLELDDVRRTMTMRRAAISEAALRTTELALDVAVQ